MDQEAAKAPEARLTSGHRAATTLLLPTTGIETPLRNEREKTMSVKQVFIACPVAPDDDPYVAYASEDADTSPGELYLADAYEELEGGTLERAAAAAVRTACKNGLRQIGLV